MGEHLIKMPDIGEGVAEAELVEWAVEIGAQVREDDVLAAVMTDKATVEIPAPADGKIMWLGPSTVRNCAGKPAAFNPSGDYLATRPKTACRSVCASARDGNRCRLARRSWHRTCRSNWT